MIEANGLHFSYGKTEVVSDVSLTARSGRVLGLIGPNGSGKTTLLRLLYGSLRPASGSVVVDERPLPRLGARESARHLAVVVQENAAETTMTVAEMVLLGRTPHQGSFARVRTEDEEIAWTSLRRVGGLHLAARSFAGLSGGEKQRVLIARALAQRASHLLLDEPTNHLDIRYQHEILSLVAALETTVVVVLHDLNLALRYCDDLVLLENGRLVGSGPAAQVVEGDLIERVYGIGVQRIEHAGQSHLIFTPRG
ncbi:ABC transporter ATP-binding protein [Kineosporia succinea]|uniref:Iron complex transport system ATP-binding protein n=1 Tax=Kineosporia succinea TaxID=84632 RepID=A0ABT9P816_9ACTN|nr:ABC transporter ATP-binding protein [Kineosporia succinea]MDP9828818.1 iron complex transport system ATP-binding protein [Kineosporia succinea]